MGNDRIPLVSATQGSGTVTSRAGKYAVGFSPHHIFLRKGKSEPSDETKVWLARYFGVTVDYLVGMCDEPSPRFFAADMLLPEGLTEEQRCAVRDYALFLVGRNG